MRTCMHTNNCTDLQRDYLLNMIVGTAAGSFDCQNCHPRLGVSKCDLQVAGRSA